MWIADEVDRIHFLALKNRLWTNHSHLSVSATRTGSDSD